MISLPPLPHATTLLGAIAVLNVITYLLFWYDKYCARTGRWRVSEAALLGFAFFGGSPAAYLAMRRLRHKTKKNGFRTRFWLIVVIQVGLAGFVLLRHVL